MRVLVTGCSGFIGSNFCNWILQNTDDDIIGVDNLSGGYLENNNINNRFVFLKIDIRSSGDIYDCFQKFKPNICFHFAAYASEGRSNFIRSFIHSNNTVGTSNVINACVTSGCKLVFTSSVAVYSGSPPFDEETIPSPIDEYGLSKLCSEKSIEIAGKEQGLSWSIIRPRNVYGVNQNLFDPSRNLFGIFCYNALNNLPLTIFGDGSHKRNFTYIEDILEPIYDSIKFEGQIFNIGSRNIYTIKQAADIFSEVSGYKNTIHVEERPEVPFAFCLTDKSEQELEFKDNTTLYAGISNMWKWAKTKKMMPIQTPPKLEVIKNKHSSII